MSVQSFNSRPSNLHSNVPYGGKSSSSKSSGDAANDQASSPNPSIEPGPISSMAMSSGTRDFALQIMIENLKKEMNQKLDDQTNKFEKKLKKQENDFDAKLKKQKKELSSLKKEHKECLTKIKQLSQDKLKLEEQNKNLSDENNQLKATIHRQNEFIKNLQVRIKKLGEETEEMEDFFDSRTSSETLRNSGTSIQSSDEEIVKKTTKKGIHHHQAQTVKNIKVVHAQVKKNREKTTQKTHFKKPRKCCCLF